jgi:hypothetical protein
LTQWPLVFITGPRSLFYSEPDAADLQKYIEAHGYPLRKLILSFRNKKARQFNFSNWLQLNKNQAFHFVMAVETYLEFKELLTLFVSNSNSTLTLVQASPLELNPPCHHFKVPPLEDSQIPVIYKAHQLFCRLFQSFSVNYENTLSLKNDLQYDRFLDHCIELAENDYTHTVQK